MKANEDVRIIDLTPDNIADYGVCGYKVFGKHLELQRKAQWLAKYYPKGLRIKALIAETGFRINGFEIQRKRRGPAVSRDVRRRLF